MDLGNCKWHRYLGIGDGDGKDVGWSGGVREAWKDLVPTSGMAHMAAPLGRLITQTHFSECPGEALLSPFLKTRGSQSTEMLNSVAWGHISFCDTARNRMCFLSPAPASWTCYRCSFQQGYRSREGKGRKNQMAKSAGKKLVPKYTWQIMLAFFPAFGGCVCTPAVAKAQCLSWSTGGCFFSRASCSPGTVMLYLPGGLAKLQI